MWHEQCCFAEYIFIFIRLEKFIDHCLGACWTFSHFVLHSSQVKSNLSVDSFKKKSLFHITFAYMTCLISYSIPYHRTWVSFPQHRIKLSAWGPFLVFTIWSPQRDENINFPFPLLYHSVMTLKLIWDTHRFHVRLPDLSMSYRDHILHLLKLTQWYHLSS